MALGQLKLRLGRTKQIQVPSKWAYKGYLVNHPHFIIREMETQRQAWPQGHTVHGRAEFENGSCA